MTPPHVRGLKTALASSTDTYQPFGTAKAAIENTEPEVIVSGPAGTGKSRAVLEKIVSELQRFPGARALIVRKTRSSLSETGLFTLEQHVLGTDHPLVLHGPQRQHRFKYVFENGSEIVVGGMDRSERIMSAEYDLIYPQEATELTQDDWEALITRLRNGRMPYQQIIGDCNPGPSQHWLKRRAESGLTRMLFSRHEDNPILYNHVTGEITERGRDYIGKLDRLTGVRKDRLRYGRWVSAEGVVYDEFDPNVHLISKSEAPEFIRHYRVIDFGFTNPFVCQWWGEDSDGRLYLYREIYRTRTLVEDHARLINQLSEGQRFTTAPICDHDAEDRATLERHLAPSTGTVSATKSVRPGIDAVKARLRINEDGKPRLFFLRDTLVELDPDLEAEGKPYCTIQEIEQYVWAKDQSGKPNKEEPVKDFDHGMDAMRYIVAHVDELNRSSLRITVL